MMKKVFAFTLALALTLSLAACGGSTPQQPSGTGTSSPQGSGSQGTTSQEPGVTVEELSFRMTTLGSELGVDTITALKFAELVSEKSGGNIVIDVYPNGQLVGGDQGKLVETLCQGGTYDFALIAGANFGTIDPRFLVNQLPFIISSYDQATELITGTGGQFFDKIAQEKGLKMLGGIHNGLRQFTNSKHEIRTPEDMAGLKMRVPSGEVSVMTMRAFGADPTTVSFTELFTALQQKTVDGEENGYQTIYQGNFQEVQPYLTECNWQYDSYWLAANLSSYSSISDAAKAIIVEASDEACAYGRSYLEEQEAGLKADFIASGVQICELSAEELQAFKDVCEPVIEYFKDKYGEEACTAWGIQ